MATAIEWTNETWNPITGCSRISPGCDHCYMFALYPRLRGMRVPGYQDAPDVVKLLPERLELPLSWSKPRHIFVNSMSDMFHRDVPDDFILRMFEVMQAAGAKNGHIFQVLTKRPGRAVAWWKSYKHHFPQGWPECIWLGTSVESQKYAHRITVLARIPALVRFVSVEPLLERVDLQEWLLKGQVQWVIVGGESGRNARQMEITWVQALKDQCREAHVPLFVKQLGRIWALNAGAKDTKGGDADEWPQDLKVRAYPTIGAEQ